MSRIALMPMVLCIMLGSAIAELATGGNDWSGWRSFNKEAIKILPWSPIK